MRNAPSLRERCLLALLGLATMGIATVARAGEMHDFNVAGTFVEGCSCSISCPCETKGLKHGCQGLQAFTFTGGSYQGVDLTGAKLLVASMPGTWNRVYVDARNPRQRKAVGALATSIYGKMGKVESVRAARIDISGKDGRYTLEVNGGKIAMLTTEPASNHTSPTAFNGTKNPLSPTFYQARTVKGSFHDGAHSFKLEGTNSFFNDNAENKGSI